MAKIIESIEIAAPPDKVFAVLDDPEHFPEWMAGCVGVKFLRPQKHGLGSEIELTLEFGGFEYRLRTKVVGYEKGYRFTIASPEGVTGTDTVEHLPDGGSRVIWNFDLPSAIGDVADESILRKTFGDFGEKSLRNLKERMERGTDAKP